MRRAVFYLRVSTQDQTTANQERELRAVAERMGCDVAKGYKDHGISGAKGRVFAVGAVGRLALIASCVASTGGCREGAEQFMANNASSKGATDLLPPVDRNPAPMYSSDPAERTELRRS